MFVINFCRRSCRSSSTFFNVFPTSLSARGIREISDDSGAFDDDNTLKKAAVENRDRDTNKKVKPKFYSIPENTEEEAVAKAKLQTLLKDAKVEVSKVKEFGVRISEPPNKRNIAISRREKKLSQNSFEKEIEFSAKRVAEDLGGDMQQTELDLMNTVHSVRDRGKHREKLSRTEAEKEREATSKVHNILSNTENYDQKGFKKKEYRRQESFMNEGLDEELEIFQPGIEWETGNELLLWDKLEEDNLKYLGMQAPTNFYEEMIVLTEKGKLWHFPIDNEQGMTEETQYSFTDHVFLDHKLEPWCPKTGPIRHFMELVLVGLSKNYTLTVQEKHDHIDWFRDYFEKKRKLLTEVGAFPDRNTIASK